MANFDRDFVMNLTVKHMIHAIDFSINKTFERIADYDNNPAKSMEIMQTLSDLHYMRKQLKNSQMQSSKADDNATA